MRPWLEALLSPASPPGSSPHHGRGLEDLLHLLVLGHDRLGPLQDGADVGQSRVKLDYKPNPIADLPVPRHLLDGLSPRDLPGLVKEVQDTLI